MIISVYIPSETGEMVRLTDHDRYVRLDDHERMMAAKVAGSDRAAELSVSEFSMSQKLNAIKVVISTTDCSCMSSKCAHCLIKAILERDS